ncbi:MAG: phage major capsid protein [Clostridiales bacterium]|nr:phage major capsid protein [Clostridiales bacterium]
MNLLELLKKAQEKRKALYESIKVAATNDELDKIELDIRKVDLEIKTLEEKIQANNNDEDPATRSFGSDPEQIGGEFNPLGTYKRSENQGSINENSEEDVYSSLEYRKAFRNYVVNGTPIPEQYRGTEQRADALTVVTDVAAVIPTTIMNKVIEDLTVDGKILAKITQTQFQGGVDIPISEIIPEAKWLSSETVDSDEQKAKMSAKVSFGYHVLEAKVAIGLLTATVTLSIFEATVVKQLKKAMIKAIETAIINGSGSGQPLGITQYTLPTEQVVELTTAQIGTVKGWAQVEAAIGEAYDEDPLVYIMNKKTWEMYVNGMTSTTGQKIGLGRLDEKGRKILNGREVLISDKIASYDTAEEGDIVALIVNLEEYLLNSNLSMYYKKYFDEDTNKWKHKALMIADGKMAIGTDSTGKLVGAGGLVYVKKKATA